ncbi:methyltransferase domain-containing protein [Bacillus salitolerans]|uniref:Methyltransferase domain-containing protein n=1 Tax=Bacillus salitolerans TaxID=1437434 RepID=A0ABW4LNK2_9BACI
MELYNEDFFNIQSNGSKQSANEIVPFIIDLIQPKSVIDVGCGVGTWLSTFEEKGVDQVLGLDGSYVEESMLLISKEKFKPCNLEDPVRIDKKYDLAISLEVSEHLSKESAINFVGFLTSLSEVVLFSAAIPYQGGVGHINEQWLDYWEDIFKRKGYELFDVIRPKFWTNINVSYWYSQNMVIFVKKNKNKSLIENLKKFESFSGNLLVHPENYLRKEKQQIKTVFYNKLFINGMYDAIITIGSDFNDPETMFFLGRAHKELKMNKKAIIYLKNYLHQKHEKYLISANFHLGELYFEIDEKDNALEYFNKCLDLTNQNHEKALSYLRMLR